ncbi:MAG: major capsid protein [Dechloromonas sp.]|nr:major capsid protein [Dechloromonas sp.]
MASLDVFNQKPFSMIELSTAVRKLPYSPGFLGSLNLFRPRPIRTTVAMIEKLDGTLSLIQTTPRGAPPEEGKRDKRNIIYKPTVRIAKGHTITANEIQNVRAFGSESELEGVMQVVVDESSRLRQQVELTHEHMRLGAVQGKVLDADGSVLVDWASELGVSLPVEIDFDLDAASPASGVVRKKCNEVTRGVMRALGGLWVPGSSYIVALCGDAFWDDLTAHKEVRETYLNTMQAADLRSGNAFEQFQYGGITWVNYRGTDDGSTVAVNTDKAKFIPANVPGLFDVAWSPGESLSVVNTRGEALYSMIIRDRDRDAWVRPEVYSYPLYICTQPKALYSAKRT